MKLTENDLRFKDFVQYKAKIIINTFSEGRESAQEIKQQILENQKDATAYRLRLHRIVTLEKENKQLKEILNKAIEITHSNIINFKTWNDLKQTLNTLSRERK